MPKSTSPLAREGEDLPAVNTEPKPPLSSFNLFYRFKRERALEAIASGMTEKERIAELVMAPPGTEHHPSDATTLDEMRRQNIRSNLEHDLLDRVHQTNSSAMNGVISFLELSKLMNTSWKECDPFARGVFNELAKEGLEQYRGRMEQYNVYHAMKMKKVATGRKKAATGREKAAIALAASPATDVYGKHPPQEDPSPSRSSFNSSRGDSADDVYDPEVNRATAGDYVRAVSNDSPHIFDQQQQHHHQQQYHHQHHQQQHLSSNSQPGSRPNSQLNHSRPSSQPSNNDTEASLRARVRQLENELVTERLRSRVQELEDEISRSRAAEPNSEHQEGWGYREGHQGRMMTSHNWSAQESEPEHHDQEMKGWSHFPL